MPEPSIKRTYQQIGEFDQAARNWIARHPAKTKFAYAINRVLARSQAILKIYQDKIGEITIQNAATDDKGILLTSTDTYGREQFRFTPAGLIKRNREQLEAFQSETEIEPYMATEPPRELPAEETDIFIDFVLSERPPEPPEPTAVAETPA